MLPLVSPARAARGQSPAQAAPEVVAGVFTNRWPWTPSLLVTDDGARRFAKRAADRIVERQSPGWTRAYCVRFAREVAWEAVGVWVDDSEARGSSVPAQARRRRRNDLAEQITARACPDDGNWAPDAPRQDAPRSAAEADTEGGVLTPPSPTPASPPPVPAGDLALARQHIEWAAHPGPCTQVMPCYTWARYVTAFGQRVLVARNGTPSGDMIIRAKAARLAGEDELARALVASTQAHDEGNRRWLDEHPAAVLAVLDSLSPAQLKTAADGRTLLRSVFPLWPIP